MGITFPGLHNWLMGVLGQAHLSALSVFVVAMLATFACTRSATHGGGAETLSALLGSAVQNQDGQTLGRLQNVVVDLDSGRAEYVVLSGGGFLGLGRRTVVAPAPVLFTSTAKKGVIGIHLSKGEWSRAPEFRNGSLRALARPSRQREIAAFYRQIPAYENLRSDSRPHQALELATDLIGKPVVDRQEIQLGRLTDLVVHLDDHSPALAVVAQPKLLQHPERLLIALTALNGSRKGPLVLDPKQSRFGIESFVYVGPRRTDPPPRALPFPGEYAW